VDTATNSGVEVTGNHTIVGVGERRGVGENKAEVASEPGTLQLENRTPTNPIKRMAAGFLPINIADVFFMPVW